MNESQGAFTRAISHCDVFSVLDFVEKITNFWTEILHNRAKNVQYNFNYNAGSIVIVANILPTISMAGNVPAKFQILKSHRSAKSAS